MLGSLAAAALLGASGLSSFASALPLAQTQGPPSPPAASGAPSGAPAALPSGSSAPLAAPTALSGDNPFSFPISNNFPYIKNPSQALTDIEILAQGTLPNGAPPSKPGPNGITNLQVISFNEVFEVAFFTAVLDNIKNNVPGYSVPGYSQEQLIKIFTAVQGQEEIHTLNANGALSLFGAEPIQPCKYSLPPTSLLNDITTAATFTELVMGALQDAEASFGAEGDLDFLGLIASVIGQEGEQTGFYRIVQGLIPSSLPFLTRVPAQYLFAEINQNFVVPGSCPNINTIPLPIFGKLTVDTQNIKPVDQNLQFSFTATDAQHQAGFGGLSLVYMNQQNVPVVEKLQNVQVQGNQVTFEAAFPYFENLMNGLTVAAVTNSAGPFTSADDVAKVTVFGPGLIEISV